VTLECNLRAQNVSAIGLVHQATKITMNRCPLGTTRFPCSLCTLASIVNSFRSSNPVPPQCPFINLYMNVLFALRNDSTLLRTRNIIALILCKRLIKRMGVCSLLYHIACYWVSATEKNLRINAQAQLPGYVLWTAIRYRDSPLCETVYMTTWKQHLPTCNKGLT
jgi:hypothetical protein